MTDFGPTAQDYARHRAGFPPPLYDELARLGVLRAPGRAVDLGAGTGTMARGLAQRGLEVTAVDIAEPLLEQAKALAEADGLNIEILEAPAEHTTLPAHSFEVVSAGQCWHWFRRDEAALECRRLLAPGGHLIIAHLDWLGGDHNVVDVTMQAMADFGTGFPDVLDLGREGIYPAWTRDLRDAGFLDLRTFSFDWDVPYTHEAWRGRVRASAAVGGRLSEGEVQRFDRSLAERLAGRPDPFLVPHRVWALVAQCPRTAALGEEPGC